MTNKLKYTTLHSGMDSTWVLTAAQKHVRFRQARQKRRSKTLNANNANDQTHDPSEFIVESDRIEELDIVRTPEHYSENVMSTLSDTQQLQPSIQPLSGPSSCTVQQSSSSTDSIGK